MDSPGAGGRLMSDHRKRIVGFALKSRLPSMYSNRGSVEAGGLMYYGADLADIYRRVAYYVDKILKGAKPADLPVEQPTKFEMVINLKDGEADRPDDSAERAGASGQGNQITMRQSRIELNSPSTQSQAKFRLATRRQAF